MLFVAVELSAAMLLPVSVAGGAAEASAEALEVSVAAGLLQALTPIARALTAPISSQRFASIFIFSISRGFAPPVNGPAPVSFQKK
jgi:hypothetical protein